MANKTFQGRIVQKHDTKANWDKATNFIPLKGEIIIYDDLNKIKIGNGTTTVVNLPYSTTINYNDLTNKPIIPSVGNGTLTIQKNGTTIDSFTANATADKTINITVPEKTDYELPITITEDSSNNTFTIDRDVNEIFSAVKNNLDVYCIYGPTYYKSSGLFTIPDKTPYITFSAIDNKNNSLSTFYIDEDGTISFKEISLAECLPLAGGTMNKNASINLNGGTLQNISQASFKVHTPEFTDPLILDWSYSPANNTIKGSFTNDYGGEPILELYTPDDATGSIVVNASWVKKQLEANSGSTTIITWSDDGT